ncbi:hypothetical protein [Actinokineospora iranica]|uniref:Uncharacterized protein n=1 Tax=Actinokineospora iranica TaxID=1271860 RepID=A0A1G6V3W9_9PSEU|nr:hypothetical protein [Actinokineospora iranica]SDD48161.1 hypothetical protein SAMN05216174_111228 [Actinokineospora iranica]
MHPGPHGHPQRQPPPHFAARQPPGFPPAPAPYPPGPPHGYPLPPPGHGPAFHKPGIPGRGQAITAGVLLLVIAAGYLALGITLLFKWHDSDPRYRFLGTDWRYLLAEVVVVILTALTVWAAITILTLRGRVFAAVMGIIGTVAFYIIPIGILVAVFCLIPTTAKALDTAKAQRHVSPFGR